MEFLQIVTRAINSALKREIAERNYRREVRFREMLSMLTRPFDEEPSTISGFLKTARNIYSFIPYREMNLYILSDGPILNLNFDLPSAARANVRIGYFPSKSYPQLYNAQVHLDSTSAWSAGGINRGELQSFILKIGPASAPLAFLEFGLNLIEKAPPYFGALAEALTQRIARKLEAERAARNEEQARQWLGAFGYMQDRALSSIDIASLLNDAARVVVDTACATFCRIMLRDAAGNNLRTAALAQARPLEWSGPNQNEIPLARTDLHKLALTEGKAVRFGQGAAESRIPEEERKLLLPADVKRGLIVPLMVAGQPAGILTVGESRSKEREQPERVSQLFIASLAGLVSMMLTLHVKIQDSTDTREGRKRLIMRHGESRGVPATTRTAAALRSRLNGPLAGIIASCEYLRSSRPGMNDEVNRFLDVIQRNASRIHEITAGASAENRRPAAARKYENHKLA